MSLFVDTSAFYALLVRTEEGHRAVARDFRERVSSGSPLVTSNYVLLETVALLQDRVGLAAVRDLAERVVPLLRVVWIDARLHRRASDRLFRLDRRTFSLVDCTSFCAMEADGIQEALALDPDFTDQGFRVVPRA